MADDLKRRGPEDPKKVNINQPWEIDYWTKKLGVSEKKLRQAVSAVGSQVSEIKKWLARN